MISKEEKLLKAKKEYDQKLMNELRKREEKEVKIPKIFIDF